MNSSSYNPTIAPELRNPLVFQGCYVGIEETNESLNLLTNFTLEPHNIECGSSEANT